MIFGESQIAFKKVVLVEYPRKEIWSIGFVTSSGMRSAAELAGEPAVTVFIPSTPTPFTGFTITVPRSQVIDVPLTVDEALRFVLTGGVLVPSKQSVEPGDTIGEGNRTSIPEVLSKGAPRATTGGSPTPGGGAQAAP